MPLGRQCANWKDHMQKTKGQKGERTIYFGRLGALNASASTQQVHVFWIISKEDYKQMSLSVRPPTWKFQGF